MCLRWTLLTKLCGMLQALGGVLACIASIITIALGSGPVHTGFSYFFIALVVTLSSMIVFIVVVRLVSSCPFLRSPIT